MYFKQFFCFLMYFEALTFIYFDNEFLNLIRIYNCILLDFINYSLFYLKCLKVTIF